MNQQVKAVPLRWFGGKGQIAQEIIRNLPKHKTYVEPFGGACAVLLRKRPSPHEVYNDKNRHLFTFFKVLRERPEDLIRALQLTPYSQAEYASCEEIFDAGKRKQMGRLEVARRFCFLNWASVGRPDGRYHSEAHFRRLIKFRSTTRQPPPADWRRITMGSTLWDVAQRLRNVQMENKDAFRIIRDYTKHKTYNVLIYADPPYDVEGLTNKYNNLYGNQMGAGDHAKLLDMANTLTASWAISGYHTPQYDAALTEDRGWTCIEIPTQIYVTPAGRGQVIAKRTECLWVRSAKLVRLDGYGG